MPFLATENTLDMYVNAGTDFYVLSVVHFSDDVEFEVSSDRRTGKPIAVKLVKIKAEMLPEERISGQVGADLHASPLTVLHGFIHPVKEHILLSCFIVLVPLMSVIVGFRAHF